VLRPYFAAPSGVAYGRFLLAFFKWVFLYIYKFSYSHNFETLIVRMSQSQLLPE
jgi:hypothetical protein